MNVAVGLGRLGHTPTFATWYGRDDHGATLADHCAASNVHILPGSDGAERTTTASAVLDEAGHARYTFDLDWQLPPLPATTFDLVHVGSLGALVEPGGTDALAYVEAHNHSFITFDPNCRPSVMGDPSQARTQTERYVATANLVKVSDEDLAWLYPDITEHTIVHRARDWLATGPKVVVVTLGSRGALAVMEAGEVRVGADTSRGVVDTVGAGDSFMAGLIHGYLTHGYFDLATLETIVTQAAAIAGITVARAGADPPWRSELTFPGPAAPRRRVAGSP
jgi:fructokinase